MEFQSSSRRPLTSEEFVCLLSASMATHTQTPREPFFESQVNTSRPHSVHTFRHNYSKKIFQCCKHGDVVFHSNFDIMSSTRRKATDIMKQVYRCCICGLLYGVNRSFWDDVFFVAVQVATTENFSIIIN